ncbi:winged helix-turn-helix domain-containing protein [Nocardia otitidiscaviarum]|uniref:BTAD domain-containing putative transcriptional regulator n=1 Tax=Nocardia otitidiscaviarum TaxID=1823 RepID=UPI0007C81D78|nr:BTAD domain-containing putative transcriptional regulator [Nocardia otitidiscaviarum]MBF6133386.1 winged helix-turn-helix domain-containing protein [Nocardia otitidiscaviarum]MBF6486782.1 winged helix-turn-helix domain-containing protein [Nocardia otitidiscaviarum]
MAGPHVRVLGPLHMSIDGREVPLGTPMQRAVLGRLIVARGQAVSTERLIEDLWAGSPPPKAATVLQVHIHNLRRLFEPDRPRRAPSRFIVSESSGYALHLPPEAVDAWHFEELLRAHQELLNDADQRADTRDRSHLLENALACWNGPALEAFTDTEWAVAEANRLTDLRLTAAELDARAKLDLQRPGDVVIELRQLIDEHPGREEIARLLALAQYQLGQQLEALATIRRCREFLGEEFGVDPGPGLRALETAILNHASNLTGAAELPSTATVPDETGTDRETGCATDYSSALAQVIASAETARGGRLRLVWVAGEAGFGKTTFAESVLARLRGNAWRVAAGSCPEVDGAPMAWAWSEVVAGLAATAAPEPATDPFTLSRTVTRLCATAAMPVALLLEDLHRADTATLQVLRQVTSWLRDEPVLILVTLRRSEGGPDTHATTAALAQHTAAWLELTGLDRAGTRSVALAAGLTGLDDAALDRMHRRTGGNPLFVRESARLLAAGGDPDAVPDAVRELVDSRIARLPFGVAEVLRQLSVWGDEVELSRLAPAAGMPEDALIDMVTAAESVGLVRTDRAGRIRFEHSLIRDTVYRGIPSLRRARMHWSALEILEARRRDGPAAADPLLLARHAVLGASAETAHHAIDRVRAAARHCMDHGMRSAAVELSHSAIELHELAGHDSEHADRRDRTALLDAHCALVTALADNGSQRDARAARDRALELAERIGGDEPVIRALTCWRAPVIWPVREWRESSAHIFEALWRVLDSASGAERVRLLLAAAFEIDAENRESYRHLSTQALESARTLGDPELICAAVNAVTFMDYDYGPEYAALTAELEAVATAAGLPEYQAVAHHLRFRSAFAAGDLAEADRHAALAVELADEGQLRPLLDIACCAAAGMELLRGDLERAEQLYGEFRTRITDSGLTNAAEAALAGRVALAWARADLSGLVGELAHAYAALPDVLSHIYAIALVHGGDRDAARAVYDGAKPPQDGIYPITMSVFRAAAAIQFDDADTIREMYDYLVPHAGKIVGLEMGVVTFGPVEAVLASLAIALDDHEAARAHATRARAVLDRARTELRAVSPPRVDDRATGCRTRTT